MRDLLELQTGQVSFLSGILAGFAMTAALHILRYGLRTRMAQVVFIITTLSSLLFVVALYVDVRLTLELAGQTDMAPALLERIATVRTIGTNSATAALSLFVVSITLLGWLTNSRMTGIVTSALGIAIAVLLVSVWIQIGAISVDLAASG